MKKSIFVGLVTFLLTSTAFADTWIARCKGLQFNYNRTSDTGLVYFKTTAGIFQMAKVKLDFDNGVAVRGAILGNSMTNNGKPITEIGLNKSRNTVYVLYRHPWQNNIKSGVFCKAKIKVVP